MKRSIINTNSALQTQRLGRDLAKKILSIPAQKSGLIIGLVGDLGGGKTTFLQGFAKGLGLTERVLSPTFVILKRFKIKDLRFKYFYHIDCYRIQKPKEILDLGFKEIISAPRNIIAIEWADKVKKILPENIIKIEFEFINAKKRKIKITTNICKTILDT